MLRFPVIAVNEAQTKHLFDNRYGTGQSTLDGILRATNILIAGRKVVVAGYGWVGKGITSRMAGHGAHVAVVEVDPVRALEALMDGYAVMTAPRRPPGASCSSPPPATSTSSDGSTSRRCTTARSWPTRATSTPSSTCRRCEALAEGHVREVRENVQEFDIGGKKLNLIAEGRLVNLGAAEGHPAAVMDMSFANQALSAEYVAAPPCRAGAAGLRRARGDRRRGRPAQARRPRHRARADDGGTGRVRRPPGSTGREPEPPPPDRRPVRRPGARRSASTTSSATSSGWPSRGSTATTCSGSSDDRPKAAGAFWSGPRPTARRPT